MYTGPLAHADYQRMKQEVENLRKVRPFAPLNEGSLMNVGEQQMAMSKKTIHKQSKVGRLH